MSQPPPLVIFTDLDGCLLNKQDYSFEPAITVLERIKHANIPIILASSKTRAEMIPLADAMQLNDHPLICENGGLVVWSRSTPSNISTLGTERSRILEVLGKLKESFKFRSFRDLEVEGVMKSTDLPEPKAKAALDREATEPMLWDDDPQRIDDFRKLLQQQELTLTRGGRFWHVAGETSKGEAMGVVCNRLGYEAASTVAIGDSPIDQSMLDRANIPIAIAQPDGQLLVTSDPSRGRVSPTAGATGWANQVGEVLTETGY